MQTTPGPGSESNEGLGSTRAPIAMRLFMVISCSAALVALACVYVNITLAGEIATANPTCSGDGPPGMIANLHAAWLAWGAAGLLSWSCAFIADRIAPASTPGARRTARALLLLSTLALLGLACSIVVYQVTRYTSCLG